VCCTLLTDERRRTNSVAVQHATGACTEELPLYGGCCSEAKNDAPWKHFLATDFRGVRFVFFSSTFANPQTNTTYQDSGGHFALYFQVGIVPKRSHSVVFIEDRMTAYLTNDSHAGLDALAEFSNYRH